MNTSKDIDRQTFITRLWQSKLVPSNELIQILPRLPYASRGRTLARRLVDLGVLTCFQADRLLASRNAELLLGQYRILEPIGAGGMGRVFKAEHRMMQRIVAIKMLHPDMLESKWAADLFLHEVRVTAQFVHPNVVTAYDANEVNGRYILVLEFIDGPNLEQLVHRVGALPTGVACEYVRQVAIGLQCARTLGMVHRDIKPTNILVQRPSVKSDNSPGVIKISDFGLARLPNTRESENDVVFGTPDYISPEQARSPRHTDIRGDLYSLGCTFYFLLTGQVPFPGGSDLDKLMCHAKNRPQAITAVRDDVPAAVIAIVNKLMAKRCEERFQSPDELAQALAAYAGGADFPWQKLSGSLESRRREQVARPLEPTRSTSSCRLADVNRSINRSSFSTRAAPLLP